MRLILSIIVPLLFLFTTVKANPSNNPVGAEISGIIVEQGSNQPIEYATVALYQKAPEKLISGTVTNEKGFFSIKKVTPGTYFLKVSFIGFEEKIINDVVVSKGNNNVKLSPISLSSDAEVLESVEVIGSKPAMQYEIDKKVLNVSEQITAASGTAADVLQSVPSVNVDVEGNVSLRGSSSFTVLIDGRPSVLTGSDALQQIPASMIENVEIITNPSVKYDPDGTSGIINIITKKNALQGLTGMTSISAGSFGRHGGDFTLSYKHKKFNFIAGGDYNKRIFPGTIYSRRITEFEGADRILESEGENEFNMNSYSGKLGVEWTPTEKDFFGINGRIGGRNMRRGSELNYIDMIQSSGITEEYQTEDEWQLDMFFYDITGNYQHKFRGKGHELNAQVSFADRVMTEESTNRVLDNGVAYNGQLNTEEGPMQRLRARLDYTRPLSKDHKVEAGLQARIFGSNDDNGFFEFDEASGTFLPREENPYYTVSYKRNIYGAYSLYAGKFGKLGIQGGLRAEYTDRSIDIAEDTEQPFVVDRVDFFPTVHLSYNITKEDQFMTSYSRRIDRPRGWFLEPYETWSDINNIRSGNPALLPEYIDAMEMGYLKRMGKHTFSFEGYYRITNNKIENVQIEHPEYPNVTLNTRENVGTDYSLGTELMLGLDVTNWWHTDLMGNLYSYRVTGQLFEQTFDRSSFNWNARFNNTLKFGKNTMIQLNANYNGPSASAQGTQEGYFMAIAAFKQNFLDRKLTLTVQAMDIFATARRKSTVEGVGFNMYTERFRSAPNASITLSYKLNNYKRRRGGDREDGMDAEF
ncbi:outer membrane beta-barrel family protein [Algivirga pacifica]|uniref:Outer membrane beta-barrel family protein n=1 Tax=Algivirga pacifica TaxID=1162670 RepID=A0ABP9DCT2_9BACT